MTGDLADRLFQFADERNGQNLEMEFAGRPFLVIQNLADAERILRLNPGNYGKALDWLSQVIGPSRLTENGHAWQSRQQLSQHSLSKCEPDRIFELSRSHAIRGVEILLESADRGHRFIDDGPLRSITSGILMEALFRRSWASLGFTDFSAISEMLQYAVEYLLSSAGHSLDVASRVPISRERTRTFLASRHEALECLSSIRDTVTPEDTMLWNLLRQEKADPKFKLEHELLMFLAAGSETSAAAIGWGLYLLAREPELQETLREKLKDFWRSDSPTFGELQRIDEFNQFVPEVMRIFPPTPVLTFRALGEDVLSDRIVSNGDLILISIVGLNHSHSVWNDPWKVHLKPRSGQGRLPSMTFSAGPRVCGGRHFAVAEVMTVLAVVLNEVKLELTSHAPPSFRWFLSLNPEGGHPVRAMRLDATKSVAVARRGKGRKTELRSPTNSIRG